jgi:hypothetical protein
MSIYASTFICAFNLGTRLTNKFEIQRLDFKMEKEIQSEIGKTKENFGRAYTLILAHHCFLTAWPNWAARLHAASTGGPFLSATIARAAGQVPSPTRWTHLPAGHITHLCSATRHRLCWHCGWDRGVSVAVVALPCG